MSVFIREDNDTRVVNVEGAEFTVRALDTATYERLIAKLALARLALNPEGKDVKAEDIKRLREQDFDKYLEANRALMDAYEGFVKAGVTGHAGILRRDKTEVVFKADPDGTASKETLDLYRSQRWTSTLANEVIAFNTISEQERKN